MQPNRRNVLFVVFILIILPNFIWSTQNTIRSIQELFATSVNATLTYSTALVAWTYVSLVSPILSVHRLHRSRIAERYTRWWRLFWLHSPVRPRFDAALREVAARIDSALRHAEGERVLWDDVGEFSEVHVQVVKEFVEEHIGITPTGALLEMSPWVILFSALVIATGIMWAGRFATLEVLTEGFTEDHQVGKVLAEWLTNYILLFAGFIQITSRGSWFGAVHGICEGPLSTMGEAEREALIALYIVLADGEVTGLRRQGCYGPTRQDGREWTALLLALLFLLLLGEGFMSLRILQDGQFCGMLRARRRTLSCV